MDFHTLQDRLRNTLQRRIDAGMLTGLALARQSGFRQAHISNFLNRKRGLSLEAIDRILKVQKLTLFDLLHADEIKRHATRPAPGEADFEAVVLVEGRVAAAEPVITGANAKEMVKLKKSLLRRLRPDMASRRQDWCRFVLIQVDPRDGMAMYPRLLPGATLLIDRHYTSLRPYRKNERNIYAVRVPGGCTIRYVEAEKRNLVLRPHNSHYPVSLLPLPENHPCAEHIVGRVCRVEIET